MMLSRPVARLRTQLVRIRSSGRCFASATDPEEITVMPLFASETVRETIRQGLGRDGYCVLPNFAGADVAQAMRGACRLFAVEALRSA